MATRTTSIMKCSTRYTSGLADKDHVLQQIKGRFVYFKKKIEAKTRIFLSKNSFF